MGGVLIIYIVYVWRSLWWRSYAGLKIRWPSGLEGSSPSPGISIVARLFRVLGINRKHTDLVPGDKLGDKVVSDKSDVYTVTRFAPLSFRA